jgi:hypothetical protein
MAQLLLSYHHQRENGVIQAILVSNTMHVVSIGTPSTQSMLSVARTMDSHDRLPVLQVY